MPAVARQTGYALGAVVRSGCLLYAEPPQGGKCSTFAVDFLSTMQIHEQSHLVAAQHLARAPAGRSTEAFYDCLSTLIPSSL